MIHLALGNFGALELWLCTISVVVRIPVFVLGLLIC